MSRMTLLQAMADPNLFASWFRNRKTWGSWFVFLRALFELPMTSDQFKLYQRCTGRNSPPAKVASEAWLVICRRGGKSFILAMSLSSSPASIHTGSFSLRARRALS